MEGQHLILWGLSLPPDLKRRWEDTQRQWTRLRSSLQGVGQQISELGELLGKYLAIALAPRTGGADLYAVLSHSIIEDERLTAAERVLDRLGHVIYPKRYQWLEPYLAASATLHNRPIAEELRALAIARLFDLVEEIARSGPEERSQVYRILKTRLNDRLTDDLVGSGWRSSKSTKSARGLASIWCPPTDVLLS
jgi:hypothetical protein